MPLSVVESPDDWDLFEPRPANAAGPATKRRKLNGESHDGQVDDAAVDQIGGIMNGVDEEAIVARPCSSDVTVEETAPDHKDTEMTETPPAGQTATQEVQEELEVNGDIVAPMEEVKDLVETNDTKNSEDTLPAEDQPKDSLNAVEEPNGAAEAVVDETQDANSQHGSGESSPAPPPRRITRALAAGTNGNSGAISPPQSPSPTLASSNSSLLQVDPLFLLPPAIHATNRMSVLYGLPADEALETRKLLTAYIQKQEECVRGLESIYAKLVSALKLRREVWDMCKAEGHIGEMSDGEDWIDAEAWGLKEGELRKGRFEEEDPQEEREAIGGGRKGKRRRREQN